MSPKNSSRAHTRRSHPAVVFAALGHKTRLALVTHLSSGRPSSIAQLTTGSRLTRQAITKHLRVLQRAGIVHSTRAGRQSLFALDPEPMREMQLYLQYVSLQWDHALARLKAFVEK
jgi:DNA-binding transcriptional ArsR family regulator